MMSKRQLFLALGGLVVLVVSGIFLNQPALDSARATTTAVGMETRTTALPMKATKQVVLQDLGMT